MPLRFNPAGFDEPVQCWVEATLFEFECAIRAAVDFFDDFEAVEHSWLERDEQHQVKVDAFWVHALSVMWHKYLVKQGSKVRD